MSTVSTMHGRQVFDSRGRPSVEVEVVLADGTMGRASVPSGASTGTHEAHELRDADETMFSGLAVLAAVSHVNGEIAEALRGHDPTDQAGGDPPLPALVG